MSNPLLSDLLYQSNEKSNQVIPGIVKLWESPSKLGVF